MSPREWDLKGFEGQTLVRGRSGAGTVHSNDGLHREVSSLLESSSCFSFPETWRCCNWHDATPGIKFEARGSGSRLHVLTEAVAFVPIDFGTTNTSAVVSTLLL